MNCLSFNLFDDRKLVSTSYDGTVRSFDLEKQVSELLYAVSDNKYNNKGITTYHSQVDARTFLVTGKFGYSKDGEIGIVDVRLPNNKLAHSFQRTLKYCVTAIF